MGHILDRLAPYSHDFWVLGACCFVIVYVRLDYARRSWRKKLIEESMRRQSAEAANKAKAFFLTTMSHEVRVPLNAITSFTEAALSSSSLDPGLRTHLCTVRASSDWLSHVVNEIVEYSRIEAGTVQLNSQPFCIGDTIRSVMQITQPLAAQKNLLLRSHLDASLPKLLMGDRTRLLQVLFNLLDNAVKFTSAGSILVNATVETRNQEEATIRISVADTGSGIPQERTTYLFEPLVTPGGGNDHRTHTCGFGLPICQRVVRMMGGEIEVQSRPGIGSTFMFTVTLPIVSQDSASTGLKPVFARQPVRCSNVAIAENTNS